MTVATWQVRRLLWHMTRQKKYATDPGKNAKGKAQGGLPFYFLGSVSGAPNDPKAL